MTAQSFFAGALWASLAVAGIAQGSHLQARGADGAHCSPTTTTTEYCTVTVKERVTVKEFYTVTISEGQTYTITNSAGGKTVTITASEEIDHTITETVTVTRPGSNVTTSLTYTTARPSSSFTTRVNSTTSSLRSSSTYSPSANLTTGRISSSSRSSSTYSPSANSTTSTIVSSLSSSSVISSSSSSTSTSAVSTPTACPVPPTCGNLGFDWAYYNNSARNTDTTYSTFHPDSYKNVQPLYVATSNYVGGLYSADDGQERLGSIYGSSQHRLQLDFFALNHHAYIYACETGTYNITIPYANDAVYVWLGAKAYAGWTDGNADAKARYDQPDHIAGHATYSFTVPGGEYLPIRFIYGQAQYGGGFYFNVTAPSGQVIVSDAATNSPYVVRQSCDGIAAPAYPPFGSEL